MRSFRVRQLAAAFLCESVGAGFQFARRICRQQAGYRIAPASWLWKSGRKPRSAGILPAVTGVSRSRRRTGGTPALLNPQRVDG
jgi:hypothetical protein